MRGRPASLRLMLLAACVGQACWIEECDQDCNPQTEDCSLSSTCCNPMGSSSPAPTPTGPLALRCENTSQPSGTAFFRMGLFIRDGLAPLRWTVDFGDTQSAQGTNQGAVITGGEALQSVSHEYDVLPGLEPVVYPVRATVTDARNQSQTCTLPHEVDPQRLDIDCVRTPEQGDVPLTVTFEARATGCAGPCQVSWWFEDTGETVVGRRVVHTFTAPGPSAVQTWGTRGMLDDGEGRTTSCPRGIIVRPSPPPGGPTGPAATATPTPTPTPTPPPNNPPVITGFAVVPAKMLAGGPPAQVSATITDPEGQPVTWSLTVVTGSQSTGTFSPAAGTGGAVSSQFAPAAMPFGPATLRLTAVDSMGASAQRTVSIFVFAPS
jgi:hypothetical protein